MKIGWSVLELQAIKGFFVVCGGGGIVVFCFLQHNCYQTLYDYLSSLNIFHTKSSKSNAHMY